MASEVTLQQLITQSAQATADAIASVLTARTASISLPIYDWDLKDAYHSFSIFCHTLENWLLLNCITPDTEDHLQYIFAALGTKSLEMHVQWMPTGNKEEQRATKQKLLPSSTESNRELHTTSTSMCALENLRMLWPGWQRTHKISSHTSTCITGMGRLMNAVLAVNMLMDHCKMINDEHQVHKLLHHIIRAYHHEGKLLSKLMPNHSRHPLAS